jgi:hypothetical protein
MGCHQQGRTELSKVKPDYHWLAFLLTVGNKSWTGDLLVPAESILPLGKGISSSKTGATCFSAQFHGSKYLTFLLHSLKCVITENIFQLSFSLQCLESWSSFTVLSLTVQF